MMRHSFMNASGQRYHIRVARAYEQASVQSSLSMQPDEVAAIEGEDRAPVRRRSGKDRVIWRSPLPQASLLCC